MFRLEVVKNSNNEIFNIFHEKTNNYAGADVIEHPFGNCQNFSIRYFINILNIAELNYKGKNFNHDFVESLIDFSEQVGKYILVIDIEEHIEKKIRDIIKSCGFGDVNIILNTPYISSNGSPMHVMFIQLRHNDENDIYDYDDDDDDY